MSAGAEPLWARLIRVATPLALIVVGVLMWEGILTDRLLTAGLLILMGLPLAIVMYMQFASRFSSHLGGGPRRETR